MSAFLLTALFAASAGLAAASLFADLRRLWPAARALRAALRADVLPRTVRLRIRETVVDHAGATVLRPAFPLVRPSGPAQPLRAAA